MSNYREEFINRLRNSVFRREPAGAVPSGMVIDLPTPARNSAFTNLSNQDLERVMFTMAEISLNPDSPAADRLLDDFGIFQESLAARFYALFYIQTSSLLTRAEALAKRTGQEEDRDGVEKIKEGLRNVETELQGGTPKRSVLSAYGKGDDFRLSHAEMLRVREEAENGYRPERIERISPIDVKHSAIPHLPTEVVDQVIMTGAEITHNVTRSMQSADIHIERIQQRLGISLDVDLSTLPPDQHAEIFDILIKETLGNPKIPESAMDLLSKLGLSLTNLWEIKYALSYIRTVAVIRGFQSDPLITPGEREKNIAGIRELLANEEIFLATGGFRYIAVVGGLDRITEIRGLVEEAFQINPTALGKEDKQPVQALEREEFQEMHRQVREALTRMRTDANARPLDPWGKNRLGEKMIQESRLILMNSQGGIMPSRDHILFAIIMGEMLDEIRAPELLNLYRRITRNQPVPETLQSFIQTVNQKGPPSRLLRQAGVSPRQIQEFVNKFDINRFSGNTDAQYMVGSVFYTLIEVLDILRAAGYDFSDRKTVDRFRRDAKSTRGEAIGANLSSTLLAYIHPDTVQAFFERSGINSLL